MATWKKILVSGSSIEAASITGSAGLNLPFSNAGFILTTDANGNISETDPATITGADQSFSIRGDNDGGVNITFDTGDTLLFDTASAHGFSFDVTDDLGGTTGLTSVRLSTPQDLTTTGDVRFNSASLDSEGIVFANSGTPTKTQIKLGTSLISLNVEDAGAALPLNVFCEYVPALAFVPFILIRVPTPQSLPEGGDTAVASNPKIPLIEANELVIKALLVLLLPL